MKTIMSKHILIVEMDVLQGEAGLKNIEHFQTNMRVLNEMTYEQYEKMVAAVNLTQRIKQFFEATE